MNNDKVIYIGNYKDGTGWGNAALNNILAMDSVGIDVVPRAITFERQTQEAPERILELEQKSTKGAKVCIQHTLPYLYSCNSNFRNIGFYETESDNFRRSLWWKYINNMDEAWVANVKSFKASQASGVDIPIQVIPHCIDVEDYDPNMDLAFHAPELQDNFNFLFIGELVERKNLAALLKAFHTEFHPKERVNLVIKTSIPNAAGEHAFSMAQEYINNVKHKLKLRNRYGGEMIFAGHLNKDVYRSIIRQCHCFVMPSRGEACCIPALEAGVMGLPVIYTKDNGMRDYCAVAPEEYNHPINEVSSQVAPCYNTLDTLEHIQGSDEYWYEINVLNLRDSMRRIFEMYKHNRSKYDEFCALQATKSRVFSHQQIGEIIKERLYGNANG